MLRPDRRRTCPGRSHTRYPHSHDGRGAFPITVKLDVLRNFGSALAILADDRYHYRTFTRFDIAFEVKNLLPGPQRDFAVADRQRQTRPKQRGLKVGVRIAVLPGLLVPV